MTRRLLAGYLLAAVVVLVALEIPLGIFYQQRATSSLEHDVERDATVLAGYYEEPLEQGAAPDPAPAREYARRTGVRVVVVDDAGTSLIDTASPAGRDFATRPEIAAALRGSRAAGTRHSNTLGTDLLYVAVPVSSGAEVHGAVRLTMDKSQTNALVRRYWYGLAGVAVVVLVAITGIGWALARTVTRPLRRLDAAAARFATGDLSPSGHDASAPAEIAMLGETMNTMARRLDRLLAEQREFVADASHQLRTPLTALRLRLENLQSAADDPRDQEELGAALEETARLGSLVEGLLRLARAEEAGETVAVDLAGLAADRVDTWSAMAEAAGVRLELDAPGGAVDAAAVAGGVEQILDNLVDNAVGVSPAGTRVLVKVTRGGATHRLTVEDQGPGLSDELKERALDRFWRADRSTPGTGLGLPIAAALARAAGGSLELRDAPGGGLAVVVSLPAAQKPLPRP
ncbi:MAG TPA: ATP-binding protein [Thermoleophilia bacterium]|nr:ATP-binding protein [Thermoleophilia bacterium]